MRSIKLHISRFNPSAALSHSREFSGWRTEALIVPDEEKKSAPQALNADDDDAFNFNEVRELYIYV